MQDARAELVLQQRDQRLLVALLALQHPGVHLGSTCVCSSCICSARVCSSCVCSSSASPWHLPPYPEPNTTGSGLFGCQRLLLLCMSSPQKKAALLLHRSSWGTPTPALLPHLRCGNPKTALPRLTHVWGWQSSSPAAPWGTAIGGIHPSQWELLLGMPWPRVQVSWLAIAEDFAGTSSTSPGGCCNSGAGVRQLQRDAGSAPPLLPAEFCSRSL